MHDSFFYARWSGADATLSGKRFQQLATWHAILFHLMRILRVWWSSFRCPWSKTSRGVELHLDLVFFIVWLFTSGNIRRFYRNKLSSNTFYIAAAFSTALPGTEVYYFWSFFNNYGLFSIAQNAFYALLGCNELPLLLLPQQVSIWCVNNFEIVHNIVRDAFAKLIHGVPPPLTARDVIVPIKLRGKSQTV